MSTDKESTPIVSSGTSSTYNISTFAMKDKLSDDDNKYTILSDHFTPEKGCKAPLRQYEKMRCAAMRHNASRCHAPRNKFSILWVLCLPFLGGLDTSLL